MNHLTKLSPEQREEMQRKRKERADYYKSLDTKQDFKDEYYWREQCKKRGLKLPLYYYPIEKRFLRRFLKQLGYSQKDFEDISGGKLDQLVENNPKWPAWAGCCIILELLEEI